MIFNLPIIADPNCCEIRYCYPKSKKKRIRNKWKKYRFKQVPRKDALIFANRIVCHPSIFFQLKQSLEAAAKMNVDPQIGAINENRLPW
jgi:hypothetical protein